VSDQSDQDQQRQCLCSPTCQSSQTPLGKDRQQENTTTILLHTLLLLMHSPVVELHSPPSALEVRLHLFLVSPGAVLSLPYCIPQCIESHPPPPPNSSVRNGNEPTERGTHPSQPTDKYHQSRKSRGCDHQHKQTSTYKIYLTDSYIGALYTHPPPPSHTIGSAVRTCDQVVPPNPAGAPRRARESPAPAPRIQGNKKEKKKREKKIKSS